MVVEIDGSWRAGNRPNALRWAMERYGLGANVSEADVLVWLGRRHGYEAFLKVPCCARPRDGLEGAAPRRFDKAFSTWYLPLARPSAPYAPTGIDDLRMGFIQDLLVVDASEQRVIAGLRSLGKASCFKEWCCGKHAKRPCSRAE